MYVCMYVCMYVWVGGWVYACMYVYIATRNNIGFAERNPTALFK